MAISPLIKDMLKNAVHIWQKKQYWSPKMRDYIYGIQNWIHVFNLFKTLEKIEEVKIALQKANKSWKEILIVGTKMQAWDLVKEWAEELWHHYVNEKWTPGLLTNFFTIKKRIQEYKKLKKDLKEGRLDELPKKDRAWKIRNLEKLEKYYAWLENITRKPDVVIVIDWYYDSLAIREANKLGLDNYAVFWTTWNPDNATNFIPANVNTFKSIDWILKQIKEGMKKTTTSRSSNSKLASKKPYAARKPRTAPVKKVAPKTKTVTKTSTKTSDEKKVD